MLAGSGRTTSPRKLLGLYVEVRDPEQRSYALSIGLSEAAPPTWQIGLRPNISYGLRSRGRDLAASRVGLHPCCGVGDRCNGHMDEFYLRGTEHSPKYAIVDDA